MKKYMLLCSVCLMALCADVGKATNASQTAKTLILVDDHPALLNAEAFESFDGLVIQLKIDQALTFENLRFYFQPPVFLASAPLVLETDLKGGYLPYKEKRHYKPKFHARHLFNPVKRC